MNELRAIQAQVGELIERERWGEAERHMAGAFAIDPEDGRNHVLAANIALEQRSFDLAEAHLAKVFSADPDSMDGLFLLFRVQQETGRPGDAELTIRKLLEMYPEQAAFYVQYANLLLSRLHLREARILLCEANNLAPGLQSAEIIRLLADVVEGKGADCRERLATLIKRNPENQDVALSLALVLNSEHRYREATSVMRGILRASPGDRGVVDLFIDIAAKSHWTGIPLMPVLRYGFGGLVAVMFAILTGIMFADIFQPALSDGLLGLFLMYLVYVYAQPRIIRKWFRRRGVA